jgi:exopolysaccharide biosynthesis operon protein EpsL
MESLVEVYVRLFIRTRSHEQKVLELFMQILKCISIDFGSFFLVLLLAWCRLAYSAADETDKWQISVSDLIGYEDNLFRLSNNSSKRMPPGASRSDGINRASLAGFLNYDIGRQKILLKAQVATNQYFNNSKLDYLSTDSKALWQWRAGKYFSGDIGYNYRRYQSSFTNTIFFGKDLIDENTYLVTGQYAWNSNWRIRSGFDWIESEHSVKARNFLDRQSTRVFAGLDYISSLNNRIGLEYQFIDTALPNREADATTLIDNHSLQQSINTLFSWQFLHKTRLEGNFGYTENTYRKFSTRDFSGYTGRAVLTWDSTDKTSLNLSVWRQLITAADITANYLVGQGVSLAPIWKITPKLNLLGNVSWENRDYAGDPGLQKGRSIRQDDVLSGQIGLRYSPIRNANIDLTYRSENRSSNVSGADFSSSSVFATAGLKF